MSITDELREYADRFKNSHDAWSGIGDDLTAIADRIDAEHQKAIQQVLMGEGGVPATDENMAELGWIRLPKDRDGEPIHIGDVMDSKVDYLFDGKPFTVRGLVLCEDGWEVTDGRFGNRYKPDSLRHHRAPTVEDVLREFGDWYAHTKGGCDEDGIIAEYAAKLQLKED